MLVSFVHLFEQGLDTGTVGTSLLRNHTEQSDVNNLCGRPSPTITHHHPPSPTIAHHRPPSPSKCPNPLLNEVRYEIFTSRKLNSQANISP
jgi:hypothetical protein